MQLLTTATDAVLLLVLLQVREPVAGVFSAETMLRGMGAPLTWTLTQQPASSGADEEAGVDQKFKVGSHCAMLLALVCGAHHASYKTTGCACVRWRPSPPNLNCLRLPAP